MFHYIPPLYPRQPLSYPHLSETKNSLIDRTAILLYPDYRMRKFELTLERGKVVSGIFANLGQVFFASAVLPFLFPVTAPAKISAVLAGLIIALVCWTVSILLVRE